MKNVAGRTLVGLRFWNQVRIPRPGSPFHSLYSFPRSMKTVIAIGCSKAETYVLVVSSPLIGNRTASPISQLGQQTPLIPSKQDPQCYIRVSRILISSTGCSGCATPLSTARYLPCRTESPVPGSHRSLYTCSPSSGQCCLSSLF